MIKKILPLIILMAASQTVQAAYNRPLTVDESEHLHPGSNFIVNNDLATNASVLSALDDFTGGDLTGLLVNYVTNTQLTAALASFAQTADYYTKTYIDATYYTKTAGDARYALKTDVPTIATLTPGTGITGTDFNGSAAATWSLNQTYIDGRANTVATQLIDARLPEQKKYPVFLIDTSGGFSDAEVKGCLPYYSADFVRLWYTTTTAADNATGYRTNAKADIYADIFFTSPDIPLIDARRIIQFVPEAYNTIAAQAAAMSALSAGPAVPAIGGIEIWPNVSAYIGDPVEVPVAAFFEPENNPAYIDPSKYVANPGATDGSVSFVATRLTPTDFERSAAGNPIYRPIMPFYCLKTRPVQYILRDEQFGDVADLLIWPRGLRISAATRITSGLPAGYVSGVQISGYRVLGEFSGSAGLVYYPYTFEAGKTYMVITSAWVKAVSATPTAKIGIGVYTSFLNSTYVNRGWSFGAMSSTAWTKMTYITTFVCSASTTTNAQKIGIMVGIQGSDTVCTAQITGLTVAAIQLD